MAVEDASDRAAMLADFGQIVSFGSDSFNGIFDNDYRAIDAATGVAFASLDPRLVCRTADVSSIVEGDLLTISAASYKVVVIMPDGTGMTEFMLEAQ